MKLYPLYFPYDTPAHYSDPFPADISLVLLTVKICYTVTHTLLSQIDNHPLISDHLKFFGIENKQPPNLVTYYLTVYPKVLF